VNLWSYRRLMEVIELKAQEYGIRVFEVIEYNTSSTVLIMVLRLRGGRGE